MKEEEEQKKEVIRSLPLFVLRMKTIIKVLRIKRREQKREREINAKLNRR